MVCPTILLNNITKMIQICRDEQSLKLIAQIDKDIDVFPTSTYFNDLDLYRSVSNENFVTAKHLVNLAQWKNFQNLLDIGCGDGRMILELFKQYNPKSQINEVRMIDLDKNRTERTKVFFSEFQRAKKITITNANIIDLLNTCFKDMDAALLIHVVYYLNENELKQLLKSLPKNLPLFIIVDKEDSIFSKLWEITAPTYLERADYANKYFEKLSTEGCYNISKTVVSSEIDNPFTMPEIKKETILSFMCYNDYKSLDLTTKKSIENIFNKYMINEKVNIQTNCISIIKY